MALQCPTPDNGSTFITFPLCNYVPGMCMFLCSYAYTRCNTVECNGASEPKPYSISGRMQIASFQEWTDFPRRIAPSSMKCTSSMRRLVTSNQVIQHLPQNDSLYKKCTHGITRSLHLSVKLTTFI